MPRKITQKRRLSKRKQRKDKPRRKTRGGSGAAAYMTQVAGDMHNQHGVNGLLKYTPIQAGGGASAATQAAGFADKLNNQIGGVGAEMAVPVVLMLANQVAPKILRGQRGGTKEPTADKVNTFNPIDQTVEETSAAQNISTQSGQTPPAAAQNISSQSGQTSNTLTNTTNTTEPDNKGGGMLETIAVPAALVLASNYFGKRSRRAVPPQNRYTRK